MFSSEIEVGGHGPPGHPSGYAPAWYSKKRPFHKIINNENNVLTDDELVIVRDFLKPSKHARLCIQKHQNKL